MSPETTPVPSCRGSRRPGGFTLIEVLLVTVILGLLATIVSPYFQRARERAYVAQLQSDVRQLMDGVDTYVTLHDGQWPGSLEELQEGSTWVRTREVEYCTFTPVAGSSHRDPYIIAIAGHPATTKKVFIAYPLWGSQIIEFDDGQRGC